MHEEVWMGMEVLLEAEIVGSRMYTGPMYFIYNAVLRTIGNVEMDESGATSAAASGGSTEEAKNKALRECVSRGDRYTTTLHVINSCIVKVSKTVVAEKVYRGVSGMLLPPRPKTSPLPSPRPRSPSLSLPPSTRRPAACSVCREELCSLRVVGQM